MLEKIKESCEYVSINSKHVKINYDVLDEFITSINCSNLKNWLLYNPYNILELDVKEIINFLLIFESTDYSFWGNPKWGIDTNDGFKDGSDAYLYCLLKYFKETKNLDFTKISFNDFKNIVKGNTLIPLLKERYETLKQVSNIVNEKMNGNFYQYIKDIRYDIKLFDVIISNFPTFKDERVYNNRIIYFYKLAQLLTSDILHVRGYLENIKVDYSNLIGCADYKIPQTLRALNIIKYSEELEAIIDNKQEIDVSSMYEVEIRASQIAVLNYIKGKLENTTSTHINDFLFTYSKKVKDTAKPYHLCRNTNY